MGGSLSATNIQNSLAKYYSSSAVSNLMSNITTVMNASNTLIIRNFYTIDNVNITLSNQLKNQTVAKLISDFAQNNDFRSEVLNEVDKKQDATGPFALTASVTNSQNQLLHHVNMNTLIDIKQNLRASFELDNVIRIENDELVLGSSMKNINLTATNKTYNSQLSDIYNEMLTEYKDDVKGANNNNESQSTTTLDLNALAYPLVIGAVALGGFMFFIRFGKK
jgi:hypothetical protein